MEDFEHKQELATEALGHEDILLHLDADETEALWHLANGSNPFPEAYGLLVDTALLTVSTVAYDYDIPLEWL